MGAYISLSSEIGGRALIGAWAFKGANTVIDSRKISSLVPKRGKNRIYNKNGTA